jgi:hypothetical protein
MSLAGSLERFGPYRRAFLRSRRWPGHPCQTANKVNEAAGFLRNRLWQTELCQGSSWKVRMSAPRSRVCVAELCVGGGAHNYLSPYVFQHFKLGVADDQVETWPPTPLPTARTLGLTSLIHLINLPMYANGTRDQFPVCPPMSALVARSR